MPARRFCFEGFLPPEKTEKKERRRILDQLRTEERTIILYEAPHHLRATLAELTETLGGDRRVTLCRELTKRFEEAIPLTLGTAVQYYRENEPRGEYVLVLAGADPRVLETQTRAAYDALSLEDHMQQYLDQGLTQKEAMRRVAADRGLSRRDIYQQLKIK